MAVALGTVPVLSSTTRPAFKSFSTQLRAFLGLNGHIPVESFHWLLASSIAESAVLEPICDAYAQCLQDWGDLSDREEAITELLRLVQEHLIDPPSYQPGLDPAIVLGSDKHSNASVFTLAYRHAALQAVNRGTFSYSAAIDHLFTHCLQVPSLQQSQREGLKRDAVRIFQTALPDAEDRHDLSALEAALKAVSQAYANLLDCRRYEPEAAAPQRGRRAEAADQGLEQEVIQLRKQLASMHTQQSRQLLQPQRQRQWQPQPAMQPMPQPMPQPMHQPMHSAYAALPAPSAMHAYPPHMQLEVHRTQPVQRCPLHPNSGHALAECRVFRALAPHEQARVRTVPVPAAAHAVMLQPMVPDAPRVITDPRLRTPDLDRGYVPPAPQPAVHSCSYCHKRYHPPDHCFRLYPHMQANSRMGQSGSTRHAPARAHTVTAEEDAASQQEVGSWSMGGRWVSQDVRAQALATIPEQGASYCVITANAARAVPFTPKAGNAVGPVAATTTPMPMAAPIAYATTQLQAMAAQLQAVTDRLQHLEARVELLAPSTTNEAHAVAVPSRGAAVRAACHPDAPNQHLGYFSNTTVESGCAVADSEGQLHLLKAVMLDGGSDSCLISHECAAALNLPLTACSRRLSVASGAESMSTQLASLRVSLCYGTQHALVLDLEAIVMPPGVSLAYDLLLGANFLSQTKGLCDMYDRKFAYCPRLHSHGDTRSTHRMPITGTKGCLALVAQNPTGTSQLLVACAAVSHSQDQPPACATSGATSLVHHTPGVHMHVETPLVAAGTTTPSAVSRGGDLAATEGASSRVATDDAPTPAGSGVKSVRSSAQPATRRGGGTASQSVLSSARNPAARRASQPSSAPQRSAKHLAVGTAAAQRVAKQQRALPPPSPLLPRRSFREVVWHTLTPLRLFLSFLFLLWLPAIVTSLPPPIPDPPSSAITCSVISMVLPDGPAAAHSSEQYTKLPNGVLLGRHAALSQQQAERMAALVAANPGACLDPVLSCPAPGTALLNGAPVRGTSTLPPPTHPAALAVVTHDDLILGNQGSAADAYHHEPLTPTSWVQSAISALAGRAMAWVRAAGLSLLGAPTSPTLEGSVGGPPDMHGVCMPLTINTSSVANTFFPAVAAEGVVLLELFGGLGAGLEMLLRNGVRDVCSITSADLVRAGARGQHQWLVVAGWECQDLSPAGSLAGLHGPRSSTFFPTMRLVGCLQQLQPALRPGYVLENTAFQHNFLSNAIRNQFTEVCTSIGTPICFDAAQLGARAHRLRNWWTNLCDHSHFIAVLQHIQPHPAQSVADILTPGTTIPIAQHADAPPFFPVNQPGQALRALPTLVAYPASYAFRGGGKGVLFTAAGTTREPNIQERELALGYVVGTIAAPGLTTADRDQITGRCIDATAAESLYAVAAALHHASLLHAHAHSCLSSSSLAHALVVAVGGDAQLLPSSHTSTTQHCSPSTAPDPALPTATAAQPAVTLAHLADVADTERDIHDNTSTMQLLQHHTSRAACGKHSDQPGPHAQSAGSMHHHTHHHIGA
ncbi:hypothetical protein QJQ45_005750 [Haematococcus lacustris]|nr:hypothetical protein QJQ45_005750 [Haematococcus lacustris]